MQFYLQKIKYKKHPPEMQHDVDMNGRNRSPRNMHESM